MSVDITKLVYALVLHFNICYKMQLIFVKSAVFWKLTGSLNPICEIVVNLV